MTAHEQDAQPLKRFEALNAVVELFPDKLVIRRTEYFAQLLPNKVTPTRQVPLDQVAGVVLHESKRAESPWMLFAIELASHRYITMLYSQKYHHQAEDIQVAIKNSIDKNYSENVL